MPRTAVLSADGVRALLKDSMEEALTDLARALREAAKKSPKWRTLPHCLTIAMGWTETSGGGGGDPKKATAVINAFVLLEWRTAFASRQ